MLLTLKELSQRIETVRRGIGDSSGLAVLRLFINGNWIEANRESVQIDDSGAVWIVSDEIEVVDNEGCAAGVAAMLPHSEQMAYLRKYTGG